MQTLYSLACEIDTKVIIIAVVILVIAALLAIIRKAIKLGLIVLIIALVITYSGTWVNKIKQQYNIIISDTKIAATVNGKEYDLDKSKIESVYIESKGLDGAKLTIKYDGASNEIQIPTFMVSPIMKIANKNKIPVSGGN